jgi:hypothetical protein
MNRSQSRLRIGEKQREGQCTSEVNGALRGPCVWGIGCSSSSFLGGEGEGLLPKGIQDKIKNERLGLPLATNLYFKIFDQ